ncbi:hypothetical protein [Actinopolyspora mortivallis]|uniref:hypothetical protein n=1 Tax=Actinopolyspora mortivallis TaxID=33906 RepID=UPI0011B27F2D|nr:hypothetical protein [Actinopolyspora mortivallis]
MNRVLELGSYILPAYAGMILSEQGYEVTKWVNPNEKEDPVLNLHRGEELWSWINHRKKIVQAHAHDITNVPSGEFDMVIDNFRVGAWKKWEVDPENESRRLGVPWVSMRDEFDERSFDAVAQARSTMEHAPYQPYYLGDTAGGLWLAYKILALAHQGFTGHHILRQASCLTKLIEGELVVPANRDNGEPAWDTPGEYGRYGDGIRVLYRGEQVLEPTREHSWKMKNLHHDGNGRIII